MIELGIPEDDAEVLLEKNQNDIQRAIDFWLQNKGTTLEMNGFWARFGKPSNQKNDQLLLEGISASLRDFQNIAESPSSSLPALTLDDIPCDPIGAEKKHIGLTGTKQTTPLTCLIQALFFHAHIRSTLIHLSKAISDSDWGSYFENFDLNAQIPMQNLGKELIKVFAGLQYSERAYISCIPFTKGFISYREHFKLGIPITVEETWSYLSHALSINVPDLTGSTHIQLSKRDQNGNFSFMNDLIGVSVNENSDFHEALAELTLHRKLCENNFKNAKIISFFPSDGWSKMLERHMYIDRYVDCNFHLIEGLMNKKSSIDLEIQKSQIELNYILDEIPLIKVTRSFLTYFFIGHHSLFVR